MMYPRLYLARNLLRQDGVIFVSIDDNEVHNLRMIMSEIFGEENFLAQITVEGNPRGRDYGGVARMHDYILIYLKSEEAEINSLNDVNKVFPPIIQYAHQFLCNIKCLPTEVFLLL